MTLHACPDCDLLVTLEPLQKNERAICPRCDAVLARGGRSMQNLFWLSLSGLMLWALSLLTPILSMRGQAGEYAVSLWQSPWAMLAQGEWLLAMLIGFTTVLAPALQLMLMLWLIAPVHLALRRPWLVGWAFRLLQINRGWLMLDIFFLGLLVSAVKLSQMADMMIGWSLLALVGLMIVLAWIRVIFDVDVYWRALALCRS